MYDHLRCNGLEAANRTFSHMLEIDRRIDAAVMLRLSLRACPCPYSHISKHFRDLVPTCRTGVAIQIPAIGRDDGPVLDRLVSITWLSRWSPRPSGTSTPPVRNQRCLGDGTFQHVADQAQRFTVAPRLVWE